MSDCDTFNFQTGNCTHVIKDFDYSTVLEYSDEDGEINLTGMDFNGEIKDSLGGTVLLNLPIVVTDQATGFYIPDPTNGEITFIIKKEDVATIAVGIYPYQIIQTTSGGDESVFMEGTIQFTDRDF